MELRHLNYFVAVAEHGSFTRAAEALHVAQPSLSVQIGQLEAELGVPLLRRTTRKVLVTNAGERFLAHAHVILHETQRAQREMSRHATVLAGRIQLGTTPVLGTLPLPRILTEFRNQHPGVTLEIHDGMADDLLSMLDKGTVDLVIAPDHGDSHFDQVSIADENLVLITPPGASQTNISNLRAVADEPFVCLPRSSGLHHILLTQASSEGFTPRIEIETHTPASIRELVAAGAGNALLAKSIALRPGPSIDVHDITNPPAHPRICVYRPRNNMNPPVDQLFQALIKPEDV